MAFITASAPASTEAIQDAIGGMVTDTASVDLTYDDTAGTISATVIAGGVDHGSLAGLSDDDHPQYFKVTGRNNENLTLTGTGKIILPTGTLSTPGLTFGDADTGVYSTGAGNIGLAANGNRIIEGSSGEVTIGGIMAAGVDFFGDGGSTATALRLEAAYISATSTRGNFKAPGSSGQWNFYTNGAIGFQVDNGRNLSTQRMDFNENLAPVSAPDFAKLSAVDIAAGRRTFALATEEAVAVDVALASTHSLTVIINEVAYKIPLVAV
jgi:hypothetical protein